MPSRRTFIKTTAAGGTCLLLNPFGKAVSGGGSNPIRIYHASISIDALKKDPDLADILAGAGVKCVWTACFFQGSWHHTIEEVLEWNKFIEKKGMQAAQITIPLGHPSFTSSAPDYMPPVAVDTWKPGMRPDGRTYYGVSLHEGATHQNVEAIKKIKTTDPGIIFLDDDFRLAPSPADIGGCFCPIHQKAFLESHGYSEAQWGDLLNAVQTRTLTPILREWIDQTCRELTACFKAQQEAAHPEARLGIMVMYLGSEKAGIRLPEYAGMPFRVGEGMFNDQSFNPLKGKTIELFSCLFHRRFTPPEEAFSETTAWPPDGLSAENMSAKLAISTIADVRHTMFMSGNTPFPRTHWEVLAPAMKHNAALHEKVAGHSPAGPFKHFWGEHSRMVGDDNPFSLFLALGVPFEVVEKPSDSGWTFISDSDARGLGDSQIVPGEQATWVQRIPSVQSSPRILTLEEKPETLFEWRRSILPKLKNIPYIIEEKPVVCAWYPTAGSALVWNLGYTHEKFSLSFNGNIRTLEADPLSIHLVDNLA
ncbi:MAG: hypothetical protein AMXMBFR75_01660 [Candidatus Hinthialibacteria bacterium]